jgi:hypothetical protein
MISTTESECAENVCSSGLCMSKKMADSIVEFIEDKTGEHKTPKKAVEIAKEILNCNSESEVIYNIKSYIVSNGLMKGTDITLELEERFKTAGPRNSTALLNNKHIDDVLRKWSKIFIDFFPCPFSMIDIDNFALGRINILDVLCGNETFYAGPVKGKIKRKCKTFACVINTDHSSGPGKHWVCVFVDCRKPEEFTIEYFNSSGRLPNRNITIWMDKTKAVLNDVCKNVVIKTSQNKHQYSETECGVYALYFIRHRLEEVPYEYFQENIIPDDVITEFRQHIFRHC